MISKIKSLQEFTKAGNEGLFPHIRYYTVLLLTGYLPECSPNLKSLIANIKKNMFLHNILYEICFTKR